jgi:hypothetical protein
MSQTDRENGEHDAHSTKPVSWDEWWAIVFRTHADAIRAARENGHAWLGIYGRNPRDNSQGEDNSA